MPRWKLLLQEQLSKDRFSVLNFTNTKLIYSFWEERNPPFLPNLWSTVSGLARAVRQIYCHEQTYHSPTPATGTAPAAAPLGCEPQFWSLHQQRWGHPGTKPQYAKSSYYIARLRWEKAKSFFVQNVTLLLLHCHSWDFSRARLCTLGVATLTVLKTCLLAQTQQPIWG